MNSVLDKKFSLRQMLKYLICFALILLVLYIYKFVQISWYNKMGGTRIVDSPYMSSIPSECYRFADRHVWFDSTPDNLLLRSRPIRLPNKLLNADYGGIKCLGYAVLTGLHAKDPLNADFTDTYVDKEGDPIVRITVQYFFK